MLRLYFEDPPLIIIIKANRNHLLDVARETYKENIGDIYQLNALLSEEHNLPLSLLYQEHGFIFTIRNDDLEGVLPQDFINVSEKKGRLLFSTMKLVSQKRWKDDCK